VSQVLVPRQGGGEPIPETLSPEELEAMLEKRVEEWNRQLREEGRVLGHQEGRREGRQEGRREGRQEGEAALLLRQLERKFGQLDPTTRKRVQGADAKRLLDWGERVLEAQRLEDVFES
jgi:flagellar biosynthesis/type III secretory pathway protein FliH